MVHLTEPQSGAKLPRGDKDIYAVLCEHLFIPHCSLYCYSYI